MSTRGENLVAQDGSRPQHVCSPSESCFSCINTPTAAAPPVSSDRFLRSTLLAGGGAAPSEQRLSVCVSDVSSIRRAQMRVGRHLQSFYPPRRHSVSPQRLLWRMRLITLAGIASRRLPPPSIGRMTSSVSPISLPLPPPPERSSKSGFEILLAL